MTKIVKLTVNNSISTVELPDLSYESLNKEFRFWFTIVRIPNSKFVVVVDDEGLLKPNKPNRLATIYSKYPNTLVGTAYILKEDYTDEGIDFVPISDEELTKIIDDLMMIFNKLSSF